MSWVLYLQHQNESVGRATVARPIHRLVQHGNPGRSWRSMTLQGGSFVLFRLGTNTRETQLATLLQEMSSYHFVCCITSRPTRSFFADLEFEAIMDVLLCRQKILVMASGRLRKKVLASNGECRAVSLS